MTKSTAMEVYNALITAVLPVTIVDALNTICYFSSSVSETDVHTAIDSLGWSAVRIIIPGSSGADPYPQYLNTTRHDELLRHPYGTVVPYPAIEEATDVTITSIANRDLLIYDETSEVFENGKIAADDLSDMVITTPEDGQAIVYDGSTSKFVNRKIDTMIDALIFGGM